MRDGAPLPAIEVYSQGDAYDVVDGHHRVAAAWRLGQLYLDAIIHAFLRPNAGSSRAQHGARMDTSNGPAQFPRVRRQGEVPAVQCDVRDVAAITVETLQGRLVLTLDRAGYVVVAVPREA